MTRLVSAALAGLLAAGVGVRAAELAGALLTPYLTLQAALSDDSMAGVADAAKALAAAARQLGPAAAPLAANATTLASAKTIYTARDAFGEVSASLVAYAEKTGATLPAGVHIAYCPMAEKPWVQKGTTIQNPYYGSEMLDCGSIKK